MPHTCLESHGEDITSWDENTERLDMEGKRWVCDDPGEDVRTSLRVLSVRCCAKSVHLAVPRMKSCDVQK